MSCERNGLVNPTGSKTKKGESPRRRLRAARLSRWVGRTDEGLGEERMIIIAASLVSRSKVRGNTYRRWMVAAPQGTESGL